MKPPVIAVHSESARRSYVAPSGTPATNLSRQRSLQPSSAPAQQSHGHSHRAYTSAQILGLLHMSARTFSRLKRKGQLCFLEELEPRLGRVIRYRADLVDRYLTGRWGHPRAFRKSA